MSGTRTNSETTDRAQLGAAVTRHDGHPLRAVDGQEEVVRIAAAEIHTRIQALDREWDIERVLEVNASGLALTGLVLGATVDRRWLALTGGVLAFLLQHGVQGWCPPLPVLRRLGFRTRDEINREKHALRSALEWP